MLPLVTALAHAQVAPPIVNGDTTSDWPAVGTLIGCWGSCFSYCSATLVDERWLITAAHCIEALEDYERSGYTMWFGVGPRLGSLTDSVQTGEAYMHPQYSSWSLDHDIGLVYLAEPMTSVEPMPINEENVDNSWSGRELTYVGYGVTSDNAGDGGVKRYAEMPVSQFDSSFVYTLDVGEGQNICYGDSGGAALEPVEDGAYELVATNSHVFGYLYSNYMCEGGGSGAARVDAHLDWIDQFVTLSGYTPPEEEEPAPEEEDDSPGTPSDPDQQADGSLLAEAKPIIVPAGEIGETQLMVNGSAAFEVTILRPPASGIVLLGEDGWLEFAATEQLGEDSFDVLIRDLDDNLEAEATVTVMVTEGPAAGCATASARVGPWWVLGLAVLGMRRRQ